jgi:hypothetical protein
MVNTAERHRELVAYLATERAWLRGAEMMSAFVNATTDAVARVVEHCKVHSSILSLKPRARSCDLGRCLGASRWGFFGLGVRRTGPRSRPPLARASQLVSGLPIAECREPCPEARLDTFGVGGR